MCFNYRERKREDLTKIGVMQEYHVIIDQFDIK